jgi:hypothetical protein
MLDAAGIVSDVAAEMTDSQWALLSRAASLGGVPSQVTRSLVIRFLSNREATRNLLDRNPKAIPFPEGLR